LLFLRDIDLSFGGEPLFEGLTWAVRPGQRVGLVGPNGAGKTTLLRVMAGRQAPDAGEVALEGGASVGYLAQDVQEVDVERTPFEEAMQAFAEELAMEAEEHRLADEMEAHPDHTTDDYHRLVERFDRVHNQLVAREVHTVPARTEAVLSGLGFTVEEMRRPLRTFSGGWRMRVTLAKILLQEPTVLLLDEPTNHLDIESIAWLETYLKGYPGAVVLVSHDRYFLDRMTTATAEVVSGGVDEYPGNYTYYLEAREERRQLWRNAYENQQRDIAQTERFIERFRAKATKAKQAQSRIKALDRLERIPPPPRDAEVIRFRFPEPARSGRVAVELSRFSKTYPPLPDQNGVASGRNVVFTDAGPLAVERGHKVALIGKNGAGKSTLARILLGQEPFDGTRTLGPGVTPAHFAQHQAEALDSSQDVLTSLRSVARGQSDTQLRTLLGAFLFQGDDVFKPVAVLSGGERSRVALARTLLSPANLLVLDEPTNHLDLSSKAVLAEALRQYGGALVLISHDRHFLDAIVDQVWYVEDHTVRVYSGTYSETEWQRAHGTAAAVRAASAARATTSASDEPARAGGKKTKEQKRAEAEARNAAYRASQADAPPAPTNGKAPALKDRKAARSLEKVEAEVAAREAEKAAIEAALADPALYQDAERFQAEMGRFREVEASLKELYARWEALVEEGGQ
jgi:ATP-binding cassette subfamily F protein 3